MTTCWGSRDNLARVGAPELSGDAEARILGTLRGAVELV